MQKTQKHLYYRGETYVNPVPYFLLVDFKLLTLEVTPRRHTSGHICVQGSSEQGRAFGMWAAPSRGPGVQMKKRWTGTDSILVNGPQHSLRFLMDCGCHVTTASLSCLLSSLKLGHGSQRLSQAPPPCSSLCLEQRGERQAVL